MTETGTDADPRLAQRTVDLAVENVRAGGKPFACVVVEASTGRTLIEAANQVAQTGDVSAHAEITAIRRLAEQGRTDLTGCDVYVTAYPCPMCLGALYYANPECIVYAASREQEDRFYEDGNRYVTLATFYDEYAKPAAERNLPSVQASVDDPTTPFRTYQQEHPEG